jgi:hypothetical protein
MIQERKMGGVNDLDHAQIFGIICDRCISFFNQGTRKQLPGTFNGSTLLTFFLIATTGHP